MLTLPVSRRILALVLFALATSVFVAPLTAAIEEATIGFSSLGISGSFEVIHDSSTGEIFEITSVSLVIDNHKFKVKDVEFGFRQTEVSMYVFIGGRKNGGETVVKGTKDFSLLWNPTAEGAYFTYSKPGMKTARSDFAELTVSP